MKTLKLVLISSLFLSTNASWATVRCQEFSVEKGVSEACRLYDEMNQRFGRHSHHNVYKEAAECRKFYTAVFQARNAICAYANELADTAAPILGVGATATGEQNVSPEQAARINAAGKSVHRKFQSIFMRAKGDLLLTWGGAPPGSFKSALVSSLDVNRTQLVAEAHCGTRGLRGPIPSFRMSGVNVVMQEHSEKVHRNINKALDEALDYARQGSMFHGATETASLANATSMASMQIAVPDQKGGPAPGAGASELAQKGAAYVAGSAAKHIGLDYASEKLVHKGVHGLHGSRLAGMAKIGGPIASLALSLTAYSLLGGQVDGRGLMVASVGLLGFGPGVAAVGIDTVLKLMQDEVNLQRYYRNWGAIQFDSNPDVTAEQMGKAFCEHRRDLEMIAKRKLEEEKRRQKAEAARLEQEKLQEMRRHFAQRKRHMEIFNFCHRQADPVACIRANQNK